MMNHSLLPTSLDRRRFMKSAALSAMTLSAGTQLHAEEPDAIEVPPIDQQLQALQRTAPLTLRFQGTTAEGARSWQAEFAGKLRALLGPTEPPTQWECVLERRVEQPTHIREERLLKADGVPAVPFHLLLPHDNRTAASPRRAGILAIHGHGDFGHDSIAGIDDTPQRKAEIEKFQYDYGLKLVEQGYVVAAPCLTPMGRRLGTAKIRRADACTVVNLQLQHVGKLLIAENLRDCLWTLDFLAQHEAVDNRHLGCVGLSYGGRMTTLAAALDPRIQVAVIGGAMNTFQERALVGSTSGCQVIPGLLNYGDMPEVAGLIAPRPCLWTVGENDRLLDPDWVNRFHQRVLRVYAALDAADSLLVERFPGGHVWHGDQAYPLLDETLRG